MVQDKETFDPEICRPAPREHLPLADHDILWDFPGLRGEPEYNQIKMGYPNWTPMRRHLGEFLTRQGGMQFRAFKDWYRQMRGRPHMAHGIFKELTQGREVLKAEDLYTPVGGKLFRRLAAGDEQGEDEDDGVDGGEDHDGASTDL